MGVIDQDLIQLIDQRIRADRQRERATGTVVARDTTGPGGDVLFDGSTVAMEVKVLGNVFAQPGDRCILDKYGSDWIVTGSWSALGLGEQSSAQGGPAGGANTNSATFIDVSSITPLTFDKIYDGTSVRTAVAVSCYTDVAGTTARWGLRFTPIETSQTYTAVDVDSVFMRPNPSPDHLYGYYARRMVGYTVDPAAGLPAGRYSVQLRWRRAGGTGTVRIDGNDQFVIELDENIRAANPVL